ncbi:hypothetical protein FRC10_003422 [Ceratobasidium sp. 414]|nr:hypothetical protein FRC10_003422 [Ceratobasidium sp. 414]
MLKKFSILENYIQGVERKSWSYMPIVLELDHKALDFQNMFKVLYASVVEGPFRFAPSELVSALRISTKFAYPALRDFSISHLERVYLDPIRRIQLARECGVAAWNEPAYTELCNRQEAISRREARVLRIDTFVKIAKRREEEQHRRGEAAAQTAQRHKEALETPRLLQAARWLLEPERYDGNSREFLCLVSVFIILLLACLECFLWLISKLVSAFLSVLSELSTV